MITDQNPTTESEHWWIAPARAFDTWLAMQADDVSELSLLEQIDLYAQRTDSAIWKPMRSAPKDGTAFLAFDPGDPESEFDERTRPRMAVCYLSMHRTLCLEVAAAGGAIIEGDVGFHPTHWMPLPEPPP